MHHVHDYFYQGGPQSFEYQFPIDYLSISNRSHVNLINDRYSFFPLDDEGKAKAYIKRVWRNIRDSGVIRICNFLLSLKIRSILVFDNKCWIVLSKDGRDFKLKSAVGLILLPLDAFKRVECRESYVTGNVKDYSDFMLLFEGLTESLPPTTQIFECDGIEISDNGQLLHFETFLRIASGDFLAIHGDEVVKIFPQGISTAEVNEESFWAEDDKLKFTEVAFASFDDFITELLRMLQIGVSEYASQEKIRRSVIY